MMEELIKQIKIQEYQVKRLIENSLKDNSTFFIADIYLLSVISKFFSILKGLLTLIIQKNYDASLALLRVHIDTLLRFYALFLTTDAKGLTVHVIERKGLNKFKENGKKFTDTYLIDNIEKHYPKIKELYKETCAYVHFSEKQIYNTVDFNKIDQGQKHKDNNIDQYINFAKKDSKELFKILLDSIIYINSCFVDLLKSYLEKRNLT